MKKLIICFVFILSLFLPVQSFSANTFDQTEVPLNKVFTITFNQMIDATTATADNIKIVNDATQQPLTNLSFAVSNDKKSVTVKNNILYDPGSNYTLTISTKIKSASGRNLINEVQMRFTTMLPTSVATQMKIHYIDVGQGDSTLIQFEDGKTALIDAGTRSYGDDVVTYIKGLGITYLDYVVATHPDADHIGGLIDVVNNFKIGTFLDSGKVHTSQTYFDLLSAIQSKNIKYKTPKIGEILFHDVVKDSYLQVLYVDSLASDNNDASIVLKAGLGDINLLFMADASKDLEDLLADGYDTVNVQILKAGHHGSNTSSSLSFLKAVKPEVVILSYGKDNSYGHPHSEVMENINAVNAKPYATAENGTIIVTTNGKTYSITGKPTTVTPTIPTPEPTPNKTYKNCTELRVDFPDGVPAGHWAYQSTMDRDKDGWACE